ncbi:MAG TPA: 4-hydroxy-3-methylbut-2-enyl diphosphate reductase [Gammaproteobacteria bacterium]|nr:4-hydroxy-3-methylbut-2-enyl diphosphate reductase [Gammaproteobacteria bacterium]
MEILRASPRGFCAGVDRAIEIVERALEQIGAPIYVRHEVVHNRFVVNRLKQAGAVFVDELEDVPDGQTVIFSAHGVPLSVRFEAERRKLRIFDATCPLVTKVHREVTRHHANGYQCILIGHAGHPEVEGTIGQIDTGITLVEKPEDVEKLDLGEIKNLAYVTQTTLSIDDTANVIAALKRRYPNIQGPRKDDICYATQNRQDAVKRLAEKCDMVFVVGSTNSSNSNRLRELAEKKGVRSFLIDNEDEIDPEWLQNINILGITAGASAPEDLVEGVILRCQKLTSATVSDLAGPVENVTFALPVLLR